GRGSCGGARAAQAPSTPFLPMLALVQHLCTQAPERADVRSRVSSAVLTLLRRLPAGARGRFAVFLQRLSRSPKVPVRGFAVEIASRLLREPWLWEKSDQATDVIGAEDIGETGGGSGSGGGGSSGGGASNGGSSGTGGDIGGGGQAVALLQVMVSRCSDKAPTVRSRAAAALCGALEHNTPSSPTPTAGFAIAAAAAAAAVPAAIPSLRSAALSLSGGADSAGEAPLLEVLRLRVRDDKAAVRRYAVAALGALL
ncbi:unnamed protein product, partial [Phaeothamnion confervicola]